MKTKEKNYLLFISFWKWKLFCFVWVWLLLFDITCHHCFFIVRRKKIEQQLKRHTITLGDHQQLFSTLSREKRNQDKLYKKRFQLDSLFLFSFLCRYRCNLSSLLLVFFSSWHNVIPNFFCPRTMLWKSGKLSVFTCIICNTHIFIKYLRKTKCETKNYRNILFLYKQQKRDNLFFSPMMPLLPKRNCYWHWTCHLLLSTALQRENNFNSRAQNSANVEPRNSRHVLEFYYCEIFLFSFTLFCLHFLLQKSSFPDHVLVVGLIPFFFF